MTQIPMNDVVSMEIRHARQQLLRVTTKHRLVKATKSEKETDNRVIIL